MTNTKSSFSVLIALSDISTSTIISYHLERYGFVVNSVQDTEMLLDTVHRIEPDIMILDEDIPGSIKAQNICSIIKNDSKTSNIKIIYATSADQVKESTADSYIKKPFVPSELVGKVKSFASSQVLSHNKKIIQYRDIEMNLNTFRVSRNQKVIHLGPNEFKILQCFLEMPGRTLSREHILNYVWGHNSQVEPRTIDVHINRLRSALKGSNTELPLIKTVRSEGYAFSAPPEIKVKTPSVV